MKLCYVAVLRHLTEHPVQLSSKYQILQMQTMHTLHYTTVTCSVKATRPPPCISGAMLQTMPLSYTETFRAGNLHYETQLNIAAQGN